MEKGIASFSTSERHALIGAAQTCASFSFIGSMCILWSYFRFKQLRKLSFQLVACLALADIGADISYFMGSPNNNTPLCTAQAMLQQYFQVASFLWTVVIAFALYEVTMNLHVFGAEQHLWTVRFHVFVWLTSLFLAICPLFTNNYGNTGAWCWIDTTDKAELDTGTLWRYLVLYMPLWCAAAYQVVVYGVIIRHVGRFATNSRQQYTGQGEEAPTPRAGEVAQQEARILRFIRRLYLYPLILILCWTIPTINRIHNSAQPNNSIYGLYFIQACTVRLQGFLNAIAYGFTDSVQAAWSELECTQQGCMKITRRASQVTEAGGRKDADGGGVVLSPLPAGSARGSATNSSSRAEQVEAGRAEATDVDGLSVDRRNAELV